MSLVILHEEKLVLFAILCQPIEPRVSSKHWMKHALFLFIIWLVNLHPVAGSELTGKSRISILTLDPGKEMYTIFGHTAIRVRDETLGLDRVYNFGTFDASTPFFYLKFLQGDLNYFLSITDFDYFFRNTVDEKRSIVEQILNLTYPERQKIFNTLERQYHSNARFYKYDFFYDNCATRVRDIVFNVDVKKIAYDTMQFCCKTFRELLKPYISRNYWLDLGINLVLGRGADIMAGSRNFMFLPDYIRSILNETPAVAYERTLFEMPWSGVRKFNSTYLAPWILMAASLFLFYNMKFRKFIFTSFLGAFSGIGLVLLIISTISVNKTLSGNLNIWWTLPSLVVLLTRNERINRVFKLVYFIHIILNIFSGIFLVKGFSGTFLPWMITMAIMLLSDILQDENFTPGFTPWFLKNSTFIDQRLQIVSKH